MLLSMKLTDSQGIASSTKTESDSGGRMNGVQQTISDFTAFLQTGPSPLSKGTITNYTCIIRNALELASSEDLLDPQMLIYLRSITNESYRGTFTSAWKAFAQFCDINRDVELPTVPEIRRVRYVHPIEPDLRIILSKHYDGVPKDLDWQKFATEEKDQKVVTAALRCYEFFTGERQPRADQPLIPRSAESNDPVPQWVMEAILGTKRRMTDGAAEIFHRDINAQIAAAGLSIRVSKAVYGLFVIGGESIRRKTSGSRDVMFEECERAIMEKAPSTLVLTLKSYLGIKKEQEAEVAGVLFQ